MTTRKTGKPRGRPIDIQKQEAMLDAGWTMFLQRGVEAVPLEAVASRAGVSKRTLYKHFPDKAALFEAGVLREMKAIEDAQKIEHGHVPTGDLRSTLRQFGLGIMGFIVSDTAVSFYNALAAELSRHPVLAKSFYDMGPGRTRANLALILADAAKRGELAIDNAEEAAEHLFGLWQGFSNFQLSLGVEGERVRKHLPERVNHAIERFLRAYAPSNS